ncbi:MAG TPA: glycosyltransferase family 4 protein [Solirubrobacteraceae bacterium]|nr:glycosyltransferase family 4 protein [Solirubrobacteraceae bacterium]
MSRFVGRRVAGPREPAARTVTVHMVPAVRRRPIALVSDAIGFGGAEVYLATLVAALADELDFIAIVGEQTGAEAARRLADAGARVARVPGLGRIPRPGALRRLAATLRAADPAVVHANATDQGDGLSAILAASLLRRPLAVTVHLALDGRARHHEALSGWALRRAGAVIAVSDAVARRLSALGVRATVVRNGLPAPVRAPAARAALGVDEDAVLVGGIGRLAPQKGWDVLCRAAPALRERCPAAVVAIVGDGPERPRLEELAAEHGVRLLGPREDAASLLGAFDVLAAPSRFEGLPLVPIEALHAGVAVVASDIDGLRDVVDDAGVLVAPDDPAALGAALGERAADPRRRSQLAARGRARAAERFGVRRMARETLAVYERLLAVPAGGPGSVTIPA